MNGDASREASRGAGVPAARLPSPPSEKDAEAFGGYRVKGLVLPELKRAPLPVELTDIVDAMRPDSVNRLGRSAAAGLTLPSAVHDTPVSTRKALASQL